MSKGIACRCKGSLADRLKNWVVVDYKCNHSAFSGYHRTPSDYSALKCNACGARWRTKAGYVYRVKYQKPADPLNEIEAGLAGLKCNSFFINAVLAALNGGETTEAIKTIFEQSLDNRPLVSNLVGEDLLQKIEEYERDYRRGLALRAGLLG